MIKEWIVGEYNEGVRLVIQGRRGRIKGIAQVKEAEYSVHESLLQVPELGSWRQ